MYILFFVSHYFFPIKANAVDENFTNNSSDDDELGLLSNLFHHNIDPFLDHPLLQGCELIVRGLFCVLSAINSLVDERNADLVAVRIRWDFSSLVLGLIPGE